MPEVITRHELLANRPLPQEEVYLPDFDRIVHVRGMTAYERTAFETGIADNNPEITKVRKRQFRERLIVACCFDAAGNRLFASEDIKTLGERSAESLEPIVNAAVRLCGFEDKSVEELAKNSEPTANEGSPTG